MSKIDDTADRRGVTLFARYAQVAGDSHERWHLVEGATRDEVSDAALVARGFNLAAQTLDMRGLPDAEREELLGSLRLLSGQRNERKLADREAELLARCPRLDAPGLDLDAALVRYVVSWPGGEAAADVPFADRQALALEQARQLAAEEQRRGVTLRMAWSGGPQRAGVHLEWGPVADGLAEPELLLALRLRAVDLAASAGVPTSATVAEGARALLLGLGDVLATPLREGAASVTALKAVRSEKVATLALKADPGPERAAALLAALRAAVHPVWLDLAPLNHSPEARGRMFRLLGGLHKGSGERKAVVDGSPVVGSPITREMVAPYVAQLADERAREQARMAARATRVRAPRAARAATPQDREAVDSLTLPSGERALSHEGALALGTVACRLGVPAELVPELVARLAHPDKRSSRERTARDAYARTPARDAKGAPSVGWTRLVDDLGDERAEELRALLEELGDEDELEDAAPTVSEPRRLPVVELEQRVGFNLRMLTTPGAAGVDRSPTGLGKTYALVTTLVRMYASPETKPARGCLVAVSSHAAAEALLLEMACVAAREGLPMPRAAHVEAQRCMPQLPEREREHRQRLYRKAAALRWNPVRACDGCPYAERSETTGALLCDWRRENPEAWKADVVIGMKAHLALAGFWDDRGAAFNRVAIDEDASDVLVVPCVVTRETAERTIARLAAVPEIVRRRAEFRAAQPVQPPRAPDGSMPPARERTEAERRATLRGAEHYAQAALAARAVLLAMLPVLDAPEGVHVLRDLGVLSVSLLRGATSPIVRALEGLLFNMPRHAYATWGAAVADRGDPLTNLPNMLPVVEHVVREQAAGREVRVFVGCEDGEKVLRLDARRPIPRGHSVLSLDASAHPGLLEADLARPVEVLDSGVPSSVRVVQLTDTRWSRTHLGLTKRAKDGDPATFAARLARVAQAVAAIVRREGVRHAGVVTFKALAPELLRRLGELCPGVTFESLYFGNLRGSNALKGVDLLTVVGTPSPPPHEVVRRAMRLGASGEELAEQPRWHNGEGARRWGFASPIMREAERTAVGAELVQAVGRGPRGTEVPRAGVWLFSSYGLPADALPWPVILTTIPGAALDPLAVEAWPRVAAVLEADPAAGKRTVARASGVSKRVAARCLLAWRSVWCATVARSSKSTSLRGADPRGALPGDLAVRLGVSRRALAQALSVPESSLRRWLSGDTAPGDVIDRAARLLADHEDRAAPARSCAA